MRALRILAIGWSITALTVGATWAQDPTFPEGPDYGDAFVLPDVSGEFNPMVLSTQDVSYGGSFFTLVDAGKLGLEITPANVDSLTREAAAISEAAASITVSHPERPQAKQERLVYFYCLSTDENEECDARSLAVGPSGNFDRSPCGTGTSALLAALHARGRVSIGEPFRVESVNRSRFDAAVVEETRVGNLEAIVPEITSSAFITGRHEFHIDPSDPLKHGFLI